MEPAYKLLSASEFIEACPNDRRRYQLLGGAVVAMSPPGQAHQIIHMNLAFELGAALRANHPDCRLHGEAGIVPMGLSGRDYFEADIAFACAPAEQESRGVVDQPLLIVEILSPSTERDDIYIKLPAYQRIRSVLEILYIESERVGATIYSRNLEGWREIALAGGEARLRLETIGLDVPLGAVYRGIPDR